MTLLICSSTGKSITLLGESIASGGEGNIYRTNQNGYIAKIYKNQPTTEQVQKLEVMIAHPPTEPNSHLNHISFAWPKSALKNAQGDIKGFLMPEVKGGTELIAVYNPQHRKALKLEIDWRFLHTTALNIASIIAALHEAGYVLGDIKQQNILVNNRALASIIDTDSFQVKNPKNGKLYRCLVGSLGYTPPELIGKEFSSLEQTEIHDRFRLALIIYQLLFGGETPFQGRWTGAGDTPQPNELVRRGLWLYAPYSLLQAVERTIPFEIVHPEVRRCFLRCFNDGYQNPNLRPTAKEWLEALKVANDKLILCGRVDSHYYSRTYGKCYWCDRSTKLGVDIFPGVVKVNSSTKGENNRITDKIYPGSLPDRNVNKGKEYYRSIPWIGLAFMSLLYALPGFAIVDDLSKGFNTSHLYFIFIFVSLVLASLPNSFYNSILEIPMVPLILPYILPFQIIAIIYFYTKQKLNKSFSRWHQFLITFSTSPLGLFLGWLIYKISH